MCPCSLGPRILIFYRKLSLVLVPCVYCIYNTRSHAIIISTLRTKQVDVIQLACVHVHDHVHYVVAYHIQIEPCNSFNIIIGLMLSILLFFVDFVSKRDTSYVQSCMHV